jgi:hypothetical protein
MSTVPQPVIKSPQAAESASTKLPPAKPPVGRQIVDDPRAPLRRSVYALLIAISVGVMTGRVLAVNSEYQIGAENVLKNQGREDWQKQRPFLSGNDRSRWLTARALVEKGTYAIDQYVTDPKTYPNWDTIDMVMHQDASGTPHLYSSKPPLLATLYAAPYWAIYKVTGAIRGTPVTLSTNPYEIGRGIILLVNVLPLIVYFFVLAKIVERYGRTDWGRVFVMAAATFGTFLTTFAIVLNNHLPAAVAAAIALYAVLRIWYDGEQRLRYFVLAGFFAAFTASCELPALSFFALITAALLWKFPRPTLVAYIPASLVIVLPFFATNWLAHRSLIPPYAHREHNRQPDAAINPAAQGPTQTTSDAAKNEAAKPSAETSKYFDGVLTLESGQTVRLHGNEDNWYDYEFSRTDGRIAQGYWRNPQGIDAGEASIGKYAFNLLIGHHGIFSLTPVWLLAIPGVFLLWLGAEYRLRDLAILIALITVVCIAFYILRPTVERNYGGMTSGFRWVFWLAPLWLMAVLPAADKLSVSRWGRLLGCVFIAFSALSASYPIWNPWTQPWLMHLWEYMGW